jgi:hypothetical protein
MLAITHRWCRSALAVTLVAAAPAAFGLNVAVLGNSSVVTALQDGGNTATQIDETQLEAGIMSYDVLVMAHSAGRNAASCLAIQNFLNAGKGVVTEWNDVYDLFTTSGPNLYATSGLQCALFAGNVDYGDDVGTNTPVNVTNAASPLVTGLPNPIQLQGGSEFFFKVTGYNTGLWSVVATYDGHGSTGNAAIMTAPYNGAGIVVVGVFDYEDVIPGDANANRLINNFVAVAGNGTPAPPPPPAALIPVPALSDLALAMLAMLVLAAGALRMRRRR